MGFRHGQAENIGSFATAHLMVNLVAKVEFLPHAADSAIPTTVWTISSAGPLLQRWIGWAISRSTLITSWRLHQLRDKFLHSLRRDTQTAVCQRATLVQHWLALLKRWPVRTLKELTDRNHVPP